MVFVPESELNERAARLHSKISRTIGPSRVVFHACHSAGFLFMPIARCGSTSVKKAILREMGVEVHGVDQVHNTLGYRPNGTTCFSPKQAGGPDFDGYTTFAVYRDPIARFRSVRRWYVARARYRVRWHDLRAEPGPFDHDYMLDLARAELAAQRIEGIDEHLRPQILYHRMVRPLDWIVPIEYLARFMESVFGVEVPHLHTTDPVDDSPTESQEAEIRRLYADDLQIPVWFWERMYTP